MRADYHLAGRFQWLMRPLSHDGRAALARRVMRAVTTADDLEAVADSLETEAADRRARELEQRRLESWLFDGFNKAPGIVTEERPTIVASAVDEPTPEKELISEPRRDEQPAAIVHEETAEVDVPGSAV